MGASKLSESKEFKYYSNAVIDFEQLLNLVQSQKFIFLDDLILAFENENINETINCKSFK